MRDWTLSLPGTSAIWPCARASSAHPAIRWDSAAVAVGCSPIVVHPRAVSSCVAYCILLAYDPACELHSAIGAEVGGANVRARIVTEPFGSPGRYRLAPSVNRAELPETKHERLRWAQEAAAEYCEELAEAEGRDGG